MQGSSPRLCTAITLRPSQSHRWASTAGASVSSTCQVPQPSSGVSRRRRITRSIQFSRESGSRRCAATFTASGPNLPSTTGRRRREGRASEKPPFFSSVHCIGVRTLSLPVDRQVLAHADLLAVEEHRRAGQREQQAVDHADAPVVAVEHGGSRRRRPRPNSCMSSSGPNASKTSCRSFSLSWSRMSSSWLRTKFAHWQSSSALRLCLSAEPAAGRPVGPATRYMRCITGKLKSICSSSPWSPKNFASSFAGRFTSPSNSASPLRRAMNDRRSSQEVVRVEADVGRDGALLEQERHGVDAEAVDTELQPEAGDLRDLVAHLGIGDVEVGLVRVEVVQVPLPGLLVPAPDAVLGVGEDDVRTSSRRRFVAPHVVVAERRVRARTGPHGTTDGGPTCGSRPGR